MGVERESWARLLVRVLTDNLEFVRLYVLPGLLFFLDIVLRGVLGIDLIDAGADMALLAVATFVTLLVEDDSLGHKQYYAVSVVFVMVFFMFWVICLRIIAIPQAVTVVFLGFLDFRLILSWLVGLVAFALSGILAVEVVQRTS